MNGRRNVFFAVAGLLTLALIAIVWKSRAPNPLPLSRDESPAPAPATVENPPSDDDSLREVYDSLGPETARFYRELAVFPGDFDPKAAAAVWAATPDVANESLAALADAGLVGFDAARARYSLPGLSRTFADGLLAVQTERGSAERRHAQHYERTLRKADALCGRGGASAREGLATLARERDNVLAAQAWASRHADADVAAARLCSEYADAAAHSVAFRLSAQERIGWLESAVQATRRWDLRRALSAHLANLGDLYLASGDAPRAAGLLQEAVDVSRSIRDRQGESLCLVKLGDAAARSGDARRAAGLYRESLDAARSVGDRRDEGHALECLALSCAGSNDASGAKEFFDQALVLARATQDRGLECRSLAGLGAACLSLGDPSAAIEYLEHALLLARETDDGQSEAGVLWSMSLAFDRLGQRAAALRRAQAALAIVERTGNPNAALVRERIAAWRTARSPIRHP